MASHEKKNNSKSIEIKINNEISKNDADLISSEQRIVSDNDNSLSIGKELNKKNINNNLTNSLDNTKDSALDLLYGVPYEIKQPKRIGNLIVLVYIKNFPLIVIGSKCK